MEPTEDAVYVNAELLRKTLDVHRHHDLRATRVLFALRSVFDIAHEVAAMRNVHRLQ